MIHIPVLRWGEPYKSMDADKVVHFDTGEVLCETSRANAGLVERDMRHSKRARDVLREIPIPHLIGMMKKAADLYVDAELPLGDGTQTPDQFVRMQSATTGLPEHMCRFNMKKNHFVLNQMDKILDSLTRGLDLNILARGYGEESRGVPVSFQAQSPVLGLVLPSNSPGVHTLWLPIIPMQIGLVLKPGPQEPWTPYRMAQAFYQAGIPKQAIAIYPGLGDVGAAVLAHCQRSLIFGGTATVEQYKGNPRVQAHGPGFSKIILGEDEVDNWPKYLDVMADSVFVNSGRGCINCSGIWVPRHAKAIAEALAEKIGPVQPLPPEDPKSSLAAFTVAGQADAVSADIDKDLQASGVHDMTAKFGSRLVKKERCAYLRPTVILCDSTEPAIVRKEYMFPFVTVVECPQEKMLEQIGPTLVCSAVTRDRKFQKALLDATHIDRLNIGPIPTIQLNWLQPHEGNIVDFLFRARAFQFDKNVIAVEQFVGAGSMQSSVASSVPSASGVAPSGVLPGFDYQPRTRVVYAGGTVARLGALVRELGGTRVLLVTDPGLEAAGHPQKALASLAEAGLDTLLFDGVEENPTTRHVQIGLEAARGHRADFLVAIGGGSAMDCAKGINFLLTNGGVMADYRKIGKAVRPMLPSIGIPTTAGTGSEAQSFAIIADEQSHMKMACGDPKAAFRVAILDPELTVSQPVRVTAVTGIDAVAHAVEAYVTTRRNPLSMTFAREAWRLLEPNLERALKQPDNLPARGAMQLGAHFAGIAIESSMLGACHACANPLTAHYGITHGVAVGVMLPHVVRFNGPAVTGLYGDLAHEAGMMNGDLQAAGEVLAQRLSQLLRAASLPQSLRELGVSPGILSLLAEEAAEQWTAQFNPRPAAQADLLNLYEAAF